MKKIFILIMFIFSMTACTAPEKQAHKPNKKETPPSSVTFNEKKFFLQYSAGNTQQWLNEYLPQGATFNDYTEMFTVRSYDGIKATPEQIATAIVSNLLTHYPNTSYNLVRGVNPAEVEISFGIATADVNEFNLFRIVLQENGSPIALQYVYRALLPNQDDPQRQKIADQFIDTLQNNLTQWIQAIRRIPVPAINRTPKK